MEIALKRKLSDVVENIILLFLLQTASFLVEFILLPHPAICYGSGEAGEASGKEHKQQGGYSLQSRMRREVSGHEN